jgi:hypothetical protein
LTRAEPLGKVTGMTNTTTTQPTSTVRFGVANIPPVHEEWLEACAEYGCKCIPNEMDYYGDVSGLAVHEDATAANYLTALLDAISMLRAHEGTGWVAMVSVSDGTGQSFVATAWDTIPATIDYLEGVVRRL